ncbi:HIT-like domain-containing protein [Phanerochaete sordida]|uniref:HIT-like domain-containing protein n=1 Tax=Phanerochaete sordida TaxID=48140 RepID=A0A9P3LAE9_9APHY|nr:HIT-like domain-containing protein [Phanerochaete sordida]
MAANRDDWDLVLRNYAVRARPEEISPNVCLCHTDTSIVIHDRYPKSIYHFLVLPRPIPGFIDVDELTDLRTLFKCGREKAKKVLDGLAEEAAKLKKEMEENMLQHNKFKWDIWIGFHPVPSLKHLHLHVMSADLCSDAMKIKKHYNSFHPQRGFFLHLHEVLSWFEAEPSFYARKIQLKPSTYEPLLKHDLECFHCNEEFKTMPKLKEHLQEEWDTIAARERPIWARKKAARKRAEEKKQAAEKARAHGADEGHGNDKGEGASKKRASQSDDDAEPNTKRARTSESLPEDEAGGSATEPET